MDLKGKNAIVTGSSKGIGKAIVEMLFERGCNVVINFRSSENDAMTGEMLKIDGGLTIKN